MTSESVESSGPVELEQLHIDFANTSNDHQISNTLDININENRPMAGTELDNQSNTTAGTSRSINNPDIRRGIQFQSPESPEGYTINGGNANEPNGEVLSYEDEPEEVRMVIDGLVEESIAAGLAIYIEEQNRKNIPNNPKEDPFKGFDQGPYKEDISPSPCRDGFKSATSPSFENLSDDKSDFSSVSDEEIPNAKEELQRQNSDAEFEFELPEQNISASATAPTTTAAERPASGFSNEVVLINKSQMTQPAAVSRGLLPETSSPPPPPPSPCRFDPVNIEGDVVKSLSESDKPDIATYTAAKIDLAEGDKSSSVDVAKAEWDKVQTVEAGFVDDTGKRTAGAASAAKPCEDVAPLLNYSYAIHHLEGQDYTQVKGSVKTQISRSGLSALTHFLFGPPKLRRDLLPERELVFCIAASPLNNDDQCHVRMLQTIYRCLTGSYFECPRYGNHWEEIGFQGTDPATDVRGIGVLGLLQLIHLVRDPKKSKLARDIYKLSLDPQQNFPFCIMGLNMTRFTLQALREDLLNRDCNKQGRVMDVANDFYTGLFLHLYRIWKQGKTISDSGSVLRDVEQFSKKRPKDVFRNLQDYLSAQKVDIDTSAGTEEAFLNVCTVEKEEQ